MREHWFPAKESQQVVGKIEDAEKLHAKESREAGRPVYIMVPTLYSKVTSNSHDVSTQEIKPWNQKEITERFPGAWDHYQKSKANGEEAVAPVINGMPIDRADFIAREKLAWLKIQGFSTVEQLAACSDAQIQNLGPGARNWVKKAKQLLQKPA